MKKRRGLSSVIGMIFLVIVLSSVIGYFTYGINLIEKVSDEVAIKGIQSIDKSKENFEVVNIGITDGKFDLTIKNTGQLPINFTRLWVNNMTDPLWSLKNFTLNEISAPGQISYNVGQNLELHALESQSYDLRLVTERGNLFNVQITSPQDEALEMNLFSTSKSVVTGQNVTLWFGVTNNVTDGSVLQLITPQIKDPPDSVGGATATYKEGPIPFSKESLSTGDTAFFKWIYEVTGDSNDSITFNATVDNAKQGNYVEETVEFFSIDADSLSAQNAGVLQMRYDSLEWTQGSGWSTGWNLSDTTATAWRINVTNNHPTNTFYFGDDTVLLLTPGGGSSKEFYIVDDATSTGTLTAYTDLDHSVGPGDDLRIYFGSKDPSDTSSQNTGTAGIYESPILMFGKMCSGGSCPGSGTPYGQTIPFLGILLE